MTNPNMNTPTSDQLSALRQICRAVVETVREMGKDGAPSGLVYAALMTQGCSLSQYDSLIRILVESGKLRKEGNVLFAV